MTQVPLPPNPTVRVRLIFSGVTSDSMGCRFYLTYTGAQPSAATLNTLAGDIATAWTAHLQPQTGAAYSLSEIDVLDISTETGASGLWQGNLQGGDNTEAMPAQTCVNCEFTIARRYRGGKPRIFHPPPGTDELLNTVQWTPAFVSSFKTNITAFFAQVEALNVGAMGNLTHVNLSYYQGFKNITNSSGREHAAPTYRTTPIQDTVTGYVPKAILGSQRRRRTSTTP